MLRQKKVTTYKVITAKNENEIEDKMNKLVADGWVVTNFGYAFGSKPEKNHYWALMVREK
jgi:hypothetical protein